MNDSSLVLEGVQLMFIGMGMVFVFLSILVVFTGLMQKIFIDKTVSNSSPLKTIPNSNDTSSDDEIAAISIAIHQFRKNKSQD